MYAYRPCPPCLAAELTWLPLRLPQGRSYTYTVPTRSYTYTVPDRSYTLPARTSYYSYGNCMVPLVRRRPPR